MNALAFLPDGRRLASASLDGTIRIWSLPDQAELRCLQSSGEGLTALVLLPDGQTLVSGGAGGSVCFWDATASNRPITHTNWFVSQGMEAFGGLDPPDFEADTLHPGAGRRFGVTFTPESRRFITMESEGSLALWDARSFRLVENLPVFGSNHWGVALSPDGHWLATGDFAGSVTIWDWTTRQSVTNFTVPFQWFGLLDFSRNGHFLTATVVRNDRTFNVRLWRTSDWTEVPLTASQFAGLWSVDLSPGNQLLAGGYADGTVKLFRFPSGQLEAKFTNHNDTAGAHFSPDGQRLASTSLDGSARLWNVASRQPLAELRGHLGGVWGSVFSPDGRRLATGGSRTNDAVKLWDLAAHRELLSLSGDGKWFFHLAFSPDGNTLAATSLSGVAHIWRAPSWEEIAAAEEEHNAR